MDASSSIIQQVRRSLIAGFLKVAAFFVVVAVISIWITGSWGLLYVFLALLLVGSVQVYLGDYVPIVNKHDSLVNKYGNVYLTTASNAISDYGIRKLIGTKWFETYADAFCRFSRLKKTSNIADVAHE